MRRRENDDNKEMMKKEYREEKETTWREGNDRGSDKLNEWTSNELLSYFVQSLDSTVLPRKSHSNLSPISAVLWFPNSCSYHTPHLLIPMKGKYLVIYSYTLPYTECGTLSGTYSHIHSTNIISHILGYVYIHVFYTHIQLFKAFSFGVYIPLKKDRLKSNSHNSSEVDQVS